jgi:nitrogen fixation-related uncharacterized protein
MSNSTQYDDAYPIQYSVDYPDRDLSRLTTFFRLFMVIPIVIVLASVASGTWQWSHETRTCLASCAMTVPP